MNDDEEFDTDVFCVHWSSVGDCEEECSDCGHGCGVHYDDEYNDREATACSFVGCECKGIEDE